MSTEQKVKRAVTEVGHIVHDERTHSYSFLTADGTFKFSVTVIKRQDNGKWVVKSTGKPWDVALCKSLDREAIQYHGLGQDYYAACAIVTGRLNTAAEGVKPRNVATATQEDLFALDEFKSKKTPSPLAQKNIPTQLAV